MVGQILFNPVLEIAVDVKTGRFTQQTIAFLLQIRNILNGLTLNLGDLTNDHSALQNLDADDHAQYHNDARALLWLLTRSTTDLAEGSNLYYTAARFNTAFAAKTTSDLAEGSNLYHTNERVDDRVAALIQNGTGITWAYDDATGTLTATVTITQYTDEMAQDAIGGILTDSATIDFTYDDVANTITAIVKSLSIDNGHISNSAAIALSKLAALTANRALVSDGSGVVSISPTTATELGYVNGVTSAIQTQLDSKQPLSAVLTSLISQCLFPLMNYGGYGFNGATYLNGNALTGIADSKTALIYWRGRFANNASSTERFIDSTGSAFFMTRNSSGNFQVQAENAAGTSILNITTNTAVAALAGEYRVEVSFDMASAGSFQIKVNGVLQTYTTTTFTDDTIDWTVTQYFIGTNAGLTQYFTGDMYVLYFNPAIRVDLSVESNSRKFYAPDGTPVFMGWQGELPTGSQPILFLAYDSYTNWFRNRGSAVSTNFTENGTPAAVTTALSGQYAGDRNGNKVRVITAAGAVYVGIADDTVGVNKTVGAATTVNLPKATGTGKRFTIIDVKGDAGANNITLTPPSGTINGAATLVMATNYQSETIEDVATDIYMRV